MNIQQCVEISKAAKVAGYSVAVKGGKVQFQTVVFNNKGTATITPHTDWLNYNEAVEIIAASSKSN